MQFEEVLNKLKDFNVLNLSIENNVVKLQIQVEKGENLQEKEKYIKLLLQDLHVQVVFILKHTNGAKFKKIIGICSGKGGVGKTTIALNLAFALKEQGHSVGVLDADIYTPSISFLLNANQAPKTNDSEMINPIETHGIKILSMGMFMQNNQAIIWQNNIIAASFRQLLQQSNWNVEYLIIDFPPGVHELYEICKNLLEEIEMILISGANNLIYTDVARLYIVLKTYGINVKGIIENNAYNIDSTNFKNAYSDMKVIFKIPHFKQFNLYAQNGFEKTHCMQEEKQCFNKLTNIILA